MFETHDSDWKKKKFLLGRVSKNALFQADCLLCFLSVHTSGTRVSLEIFFFHLDVQANSVSSRLLALFLGVYTSGTHFYET